MSKHRVTRRFVVAAALWAFCLAACGPKKVAVDPSIAAQATLEQADANLRAGCFDCLKEGLRQYESVTRVPAVAQSATRGAVQAATLLAMRERELGTTDSGYLERARSLASAAPALQAEVGPLLDVVDALPWRGGVSRSNRSGFALTPYRDREQRIEQLRTTATRDVFSAYVWLAYACESGALRTISKANVDMAIPRFADAPLFAYGLAAVCGMTQNDAFADVIRKESRYKELSFDEGLQASGARKLDDAEAHYRDAYAWRATWPSVTLALANVLVTGEDFDGALDFYNRTLELVPNVADALLGKIRTLTYLSKPDDAIRVADELLAIERYPGDAYYWKAYNELDLKQYDEAWKHIEAADKLLVNADVPKLAGIIAIDRHELDVARGKLEIATTRAPDDCQTQYFLHLVLTEQRLWDQALTVARSGSACLDGEIARTRSEIAGIEASDFTEAKKARQIAGRERRIATDTRMRATCWYDAAAASFNLSRKDDAKAFAERLVDDEQLGERARQLLDRLASR